MTALTSSRSVCKESKDVFRYLIFYCRVPERVSVSALFIYTSFSENLHAHKAKYYIIEVKLCKSVGKAIRQIDLNIPNTCPLRASGGKRQHQLRQRKAYADGLGNQKNVKKPQPRPVTSLQHLSPPCNPSEKHTYPPCNIHVTRKPHLCSGKRNK